MSRKVLPLLAGAATLAMMAGAAQAADLFTPAPPPEMAPMYHPSWTGFYVGGYLGGGAVVHDVDVDLGQGKGANFNGIGGEGFIGGGLLGYNYQFSDRLVFGVEGSVGYHNLETTAGLGPLADVEIGPDLTASASGRVGWLATPDSLFYLIGGYTFSRYKAKISEVGGPGSISFRQNYHGWHVGSGLETRLTERLTARVEYRYTQFGGEDFFDTDGFAEVAPSTHTGRLALAWHLGHFGADPAVYPAADYFVAAQPRDWTGFYLGGFVGGGAVVNDINLLNVVNFNGVGGEGILGGGMVGYNYQVNEGVVVGIEGRVGYENLETTASANLDLGSFNLTAQPGLAASVSARLGWLATPDTMLYLIGGYSYSDYDVKISFNGDSESFSEDYHGFHVGAGVETWLTDSLTGRVEYRYTQYGSEDWGTQGAIKVEPSTHTGMVGVAWHFGGL